jgi:hypothetical protein
MTPYVNQLLDKARWRREIEMRGRERNIMSERLAEALRTELREILEAGGKPFDVQVARHLYDFAIAAKDLLVVSAKGVDATIKVINDMNGPMESLTQAGDPIPQEQASETFGARMLREVLATLPMLLKKPDDPKQLVHALAEARQAGMDDVAHELEIKLFGRVLSDGPSEEDLEKLKQKFLDDAKIVKNVTRTDEPQCKEKGQCKDLDGSGTCKGCGRWLGPEPSRHVENCLARVYGEDRECDRNCLGATAPGSHPYGAHP